MMVMKHLSKRKKGDGDEAVKSDVQWSRSPIVESSLLKAINNDHIQSDNFNNLVGDDAATTSNQFATTSSRNANKSTKVVNKEGDPIEGKLKVRAKDVPKNKAMKKEPKKEDKGKKGEERLMRVILMMILKLFM
ncbi:uncharacterized protein LOC110721975 isoform X2 [Chenopodium quinoa]|nr:uncharacterized protein LOC110721975 isoform X2 [Chenopodium quinoa]